MYFRIFSLAKNKLCTLIYWLLSSYDILLRWTQYDWAISGTQKSDKITGMHYGFQNQTQKQASGLFLARLLWCMFVRQSEQNDTNNLYVFFAGWKNWLKIGWGKIHCDTEDVVEKYHWKRILSHKDTSAVFIAVWIERWTAFDLVLHLFWRLF